MVKGTQKIRSLSNVFSIEQLRDHFPKTKAVVMISGEARRAMVEGRDTMEITNSVAGIFLKRPVIVIARPFGKERKQLLLQVVPCGFEHLLMDDVLREQYSK